MTCCAEQYAAGLKLAATLPMEIFPKIG
jgi:hypothetical protein